MANLTSTKTAKKKAAADFGRFSAEPDPLPAPSGAYGGILGLQHTAGNQAVNQLLQPTQDDKSESPNVQEVLQSGGGQPLEPGTRRFMETCFGEDFSNVRVHTDGIADRSVRAVNAMAYAVENNLVFRSGHYVPESEEGEKLIAHELTHVVQQRGKSGSRPGMAHEQEADSAAKNLQDTTLINVTHPSTIGMPQFNRGNELRTVGESPKDGGVSSGSADRVPHTKEEYRKIDIDSSVFILLDTGDSDQKQWISDLFRDLRKQGHQLYLPQQVLNEVLGTHQIEAEIIQRKLDAGGYWEKDVWKKLESNEIVKLKQQLKQRLVWVQERKELLKQTGFEIETIKTLNSIVYRPNDEKEVKSQQAERIDVHTANEFKPTGELRKIQVGKEGEKNQPILSIPDPMKTLPKGNRNDVLVAAETASKGHELLVVDSDYLGKNKKPFVARPEVTNPFNEGGLGVKIAPESWQIPKTKPPNGTPPAAKSFPPTSKVPKLSPATETAPNVDPPLIRESQKQKKYIANASEVEGAGQLLIEIEQYLNSEAIYRDSRLAGSLRTLQWWIQRGVNPQAVGITDRWFLWSGNDYTIGIPDIIQGIKKREIYGIEIKPISEPQQYEAFEKWVNENIHSYADYYRHFISNEDAGIRLNQSQTKWEQATWKWGDWWPARVSKEYITDDRISSFMQSIGQKIIGQSRKEIEELVHKPDALGQGRGARIVGVRRFRKGFGFDRSLYSPTTMTVLMFHTQWGFEPVFYEIAGTNVPEEFTLVTGADFNTYAVIYEKRAFNDLKDRPTIGPVGGRQYSEDQAFTGWSGINLPVVLVKKEGLND